MDENLYYSDILLLKIKCDQHHDYETVKLPDISLEIRKDIGTNLKVAGWGDMTGENTSI